MTVAVVGGGPAGMMAAAEAARRGCRTVLLEQNEKLGKKLYLTGKGRCNVTNACAREGFFEAVPRNPRFLYSAFAAFDNRDMMALLEGLGVPLKVERGGRVFPASDKSSDVLRAVERYVRESGAEVRLHTRVTGIAVSGGAVRAVRTEAGELPCEAVVLATGGCSYPQTGSTGDGYRFAAACGHTVEPPRGVLTPLVTREAWPAALAGLTLKNVVLSAARGGRTLHRSEPGELLFTHFGLSGPTILSASAHMRHMASGRYTVTLDLKPALTPEQLDQRLLRDLEKNKNRNFSNSLDELLPQKMIPVVVRRSGIPPEEKCNTITREQRAVLLDVLKHFTVEISGFAPLSGAIVTAGGVSVKEVDPKTMQSKLIQGLYFAGEILDVDAYTGGFNLQIAFATGHAAGENL